MSEGALAVSFEALFRKIGSSNFKLVCSEQVRKEIEKWDETLKIIYAVLADAEGQQMQKMAVKVWLADLKDLAYDVDDILDEFATKALERKLMKEHHDQASTTKISKLLTFGSTFHPSTIMFNNQMMSKMRKITGRLESLAAQKNVLLLTDRRSLGVVTPIMRETTSFVDVTTIYGRENDKEQIIGLLMSIDDNISVIPIVGMGGIGKTALAQLVYNDNRLLYNFDLRAWVCVSVDFDIIMIAKAILSSISYEPCNENDMNSLQVELKRKLSGKKFLLVLDDVWVLSYAQWTSLQPSLTSGAPGSKIIVTTRSYDVSALVGTVPDLKLQKLSDDDCMRILAHHALGARDFNEHSELKRIGLEIIKKCDGLPLAIKAIGGLLRYDFHRSRWEHILESDIWNSTLDSDYGIMPALWLSYHYLPSQLKQCFAHCSLIPKDYEFEEEEIISLWMAEGLLTKGFDFGEQYFEELISRSFFQASTLEKSKFIMPKLINNLAQLVAEEFYFKMEEHQQMKFSRRTRHLSYIAGRDEYKKFPTLSEAKCLRTFHPFMMTLYEDCHLNHNVIDILFRLKYLRVLSLKGYEIYEIPGFIENLVHLRFLDFSRTRIKILPDSICFLYNLQTLKLRSCENITELPSKMRILDNLCHLDIYGANSIQKMPSGIGRLRNLQVLSNFIVGESDAANIKEMQDLSGLRGKLSISELQNVKEAKDALEAKMSEKTAIDDLKLEWSGNFDNLTNIEVEVLDSLKPHGRLKVLTISKYAGTEFPSWIADPSFENLQSLILEDCQNCKSLPAIGKLPLLKDLYIKGMNDVKSVGKEFYGENTGIVFPSLESLRFEDMPEWKEWEFCTVDQGKIFPCLRKLHIRNCPKLVEPFPLIDFCSLKELQIHSCQELEVSVSVSDLPMLCELEIDGCKKLVCECWIEFKSLKKVTISNISDLTCLTERLISGFKNVESLRIDSCEELISFCPNKRLLSPFKSLNVLKISNCPKLVRLGPEEDEEELQLLEISHSMDHLNLSLMNSERFKKLPRALFIQLHEISHSMDHLNLSLMNSKRVKKLPRSSFIFKSLRELEIVMCPKLVFFSEDTLPLTLERLVIKRCNDLQYILQDKGKDININNTSLLEHLEIECCPSLISLSSSCQLSARLQNRQTEYDSTSSSSSAKLLAGIKRLHIGDCEKLVSINGEFLVRLQHLQIWNCLKLSALSPSENLPEGLKRLQINTCTKLQSIAGAVHDNSPLEYLGVFACTDLQSLPRGLEGLKKLQEIELVYCPRLTSFPGNGFSTSLRELEIDGCESLQTLPNNLHNLNSLQKLTLSNCYFPEEGFPVKLKSLSISNPTIQKATRKALEGWELHKLTSLEQLMIEDAFPKMVSFPLENSRKILLPTSLVQLTLKNFPNLKFLSSKGFAELRSLEYLSIIDCPKVISLPKKESLGKINRLHIDDCPLLKPQCVIGGWGWYKIAHIPSVRIDDHMKFVQQYVEPKVDICTAKIILTQKNICAPKHYLQMLSMLINSCKLSQIHCSEKKYISVLHLDMEGKIHHYLNKEA